LFGFGFLGAVPVLMAKAHGRRDFQGTLDVMWQGLAFSLFLAVVLALICTGGSFYISLLGQPAELNSSAQTFLIIIAWSLIPIYLCQTLKQMCEALNAPWAPMLILTLGVPINAGLNWVLIYGHLGIHGMGLMGAGWATFIARTLMFLGLVVFVRYKLIPTYRAALERGDVEAQSEERREMEEELINEANSALTPKRSLYQQMIYLGLPASLQLLLEAGFFSVASVMMGWISKEVLVAHQIAMSVAATTFMVPLGVSIAMSIRVSHAVGKRDYVKTRAICRGGFILALFIAGGCCTAMGLFRNQLAHFFIDNQLIDGLAASFLLVAALFQFFDATQMVGLGALRGLQDVRLPTIVSLCAYWVLSLPLGYWLAFVMHWGGVGIWWGMFWGLALAAVTLFWRTEIRLARLKST
jgi:MATE family multidrug resistance protein